MLSILNLFCYSALAATQTSQKTTHQCDPWLPKLIQSNNDPKFVTAAQTACKTFQDTPSRYHFTPMHIACRKGNMPLMEALYHNGDPIDQPDVNGFTPLHHLAMKGNVLAANTLITWGANPEHRNEMGGTYADYLRFTAPFRNSSGEALNTTLFSAHQNDEVDVDPRCVSKSVTYLDENVVSPTELFKLWKKAALDKGQKKATAVQKQAMQKYAAFKDSPPKLGVVPITQDDLGRPLSLGSSFCGVVALQDIKKGDPVAEYTGEMYDSFVASGEAAVYVWDEWPDVDSKFYRSAASMINHGFPNTQMNANYQPVGKGTDGLPKRKIIMAIQDIKKGEQITIDYGPRYDWKVQPKPINFGAVIKFVKRHSWEKMSDLFIKYTHDARSVDTGVVTQIMHIFASTSTLVALAKEKRLTLEDFEFVKNIVEQLPALSTDLSAVEGAIRIANRKPVKKDL